MIRNILYMMILCSFFSCGKERDQNFIRVSKVNPCYLEYSDGTPFIPVGPNICWERFETDETKVLQLYEQRFRNLSENGGNYTRIWLSAPFFEIEHKKAGEFDENRVNRIDKLLELATKYGIKIKFCLENFRKLTGYSAPFSSSVAFDKPIYSFDNRGPLGNMDDFFKTQQGKDLYIDRVAFLASKYANNPTIMGWELWNEINSVSFSEGIAGELEWTREMLPIVKSYFPHHLVMQSLGSFDNEKYQEWYMDFSSLSNNEIAQVHRYLDPGATWDICQAPMDSLASQAVVLLRNMVVDKPVILSEVGAVEAHHSGPSKLYESDTLGVLLHDLIFAPFFSGAAAPGQSWHWQYYIEKNNLWWHFGRFSHATANINPITEQYRPVFFMYDQVRFYCLKGNTHTLVWCRDALSNWHTELIGNQLPDSRTVKLPLQFLSNKVSDVEQYDPWSDVRKVAHVVDDTLDITFRRSVILRFNNENH